MHPNVQCSVTIIAKIWKQTKCPSTDEWIKKMWYIHIMEYYSAAKKRMKFCHSQQHRSTWRVFSLVNRERQVLYVITYMWNVKYETNEYKKTKQTYREKEQTSGYQWGEKRGESKVRVED